MTQHDDRLYLIHIQECITRIEQYITEGEDAFFTDLKTQDAVLWNLHTLAESSQRISETLKVKYPHVEWRSIAEFRNVVVHDYLGLDLKQIWDIVKKDLPDLKRSISTILIDMS